MEKINQLSDNDKKWFLLFAEDLTGTNKEDINVVSFAKDCDGLYSGTIEIDGVLEYIHEYH